MTGPDLAAALAALGLTQQQFAERVGVERVTVNRWVNGARRVPAWLTLALIHAAETDHSEATMTESPSPEMLRRGAAVIMRATGNPETIAFDVWQAMWDEALRREEPYFLDRAYTTDDNEKFAALADELTDANVQLHAALAEIERLRTG